MVPVYSEQVAFITGAGTGIGLATAQAFARAGASVALADINIDAAKKVAESLISEGLNAYAVPCDVTVESKVAAAIDETVQHFGRLDCSFNNAGVISSHINTADLSEAEWDRIMSVNLRGTWFCMKHELRYMLTQGNGAIVNSSSIGGLNGVAGLSAYSASKHGIIGLTKSAALECATKGIRINAICPGVIETPMLDELTDGDKTAKAELAKTQPIGRLGKPEEIADAVLWLCSSRASLVLGHAFSIDGGYSAQ
ncbi:short-chain dehydrogenase/reductase SDR (plasmid) [Zymomonas mobilis subsp. mobilis ZM4 = ATCC 31821]|uniref:glucose 1-dehydrogenase n=1 Tax=Zymomonas mobilis TaxID=542 RepID=UPI000785D670|nr:glucose 1-dehydrogenase [Zymomonas mobilis]AVZ26834.1 short-chain dehydrogenase/reductase SDR [Zymomonas mobilis subsp. mobilis]AVZ28720.1 short-chain dehydrogenase/reductase SDR [Zymomonas mobilis subsp. mobilis]AVZ43166.1 short-chain dehydrogenase/reductase SDR [Zymomonas mobilis subsp. mobilis ZM4 = ATCC 31821]UBQ08752.1 SDR family oxidoreductase [Zymomonas mobilis]